MSSGISQNTVVHECAFKAFIKQTDTAVKFSCRMFVAWKNSANQAFCRTVNENVVVSNGVATFDQQLTFQTYLLYDASTQLYLKKETSLSLMLVSTRKPGEEKLVGRVAVNLADVLNEGSFEDEMARQLSFCSIKGSTLTFRIVPLWKKSTNMRRIEYDLNDFSIIANKLNQSEISQNQDFITFRPKVDEEDRKKEIPEKENQNIREQNIAKSHEIENVSDEVKISKDDEAQINNEIKNDEGVINEVMPHIRIHNIESEQSETEQQQTNPIIPKLIINQKTEGLNNENNSSRDEQVSQMKGKLVSMQKQNQKLIQIMNELNETISAEKIKGQAIQHQLMQQKQQKQKGLAKIEESYGIIQKLNIQLENKVSQNQKLRIDIQKSVELVENLRKQISMKEVQNGQNLLEIQTKLNVMTSENQLMKVLQQQIISKDRRFEEKVKELQESQKIRLDFESEILEIKDELSDLKIERIELKNELVVKEEQIGKLIEDKDRKMVVNEKKQKITEGEYESLTVKIVCLEQQLRAVEDELTRYESQRIALQNQIKQLENDKQEILDQITIKQLQIEKYKSSVNDKVNQNNVKENENLVLLEAARNEIKDLKVLMGEKQAEVKKIIMEANQQRIKNLSIKQELERQLRVKEDEQAIILKETLQNQNSLKSQIQSLNFRIQELTQDKMILQEEVSQKQTAIQQFQQQVQNSRASQQTDINGKEKMQEIIREKQGQLILCNEEIILLRNKLAAQEIKTVEIEQKMKKFAEKEDKMRENIIILEEESKRVYDIVTEKEQQEEALVAEIDKLKQENLMLIDQLQFVSEQLHNYKQQNGLIRQTGEAEVMNSEGNKQEQRVQPEEQFIGLINQANRRNSQLEYQIAIIDKRHLQQINKLQAGMSIISYKNEQERVKVSMLQEQINELKNERQQLRFKIETYELGVGENGRQNDDRKLKDMGLLLEKMEIQRNQMENNFKYQIQNQIHQISVKDQNNKVLEAQIEEIKTQKAIIQQKLAQCTFEVQQLKNNLFESNREVAQLRNKKEEKEMIVQNHQVGKQFEHSKGQQNESSELIGNNHYLESVPAEIELINACKNLQQLIHQRSEKDKLQTAIEFVLSKNVLLEEELNHTTEQRGTIQETARKLSMEFQMIKSKILKGKGSFQERTQLISSLKPCQLKVKQLVEISERLSDFQLQGQNF